MRPPRRFGRRELVREIQRQKAMRRLVVQAERLRISRDLHDVLGYLFSAITLKGELAGILVGGPSTAAGREIADIVALARSGHREIREVVAGYRGTGLSAELVGVAALLRSAALHCAVEADRVDGLPPEVSAPLAHVLREGVTNVLRHSDATWCRISLRRERGGVVLRIVNDGVRPDTVARSGNGSAGLRERLTAAGGTFHAGPVPDASYELVAFIPTPHVTFMEDG
jgi:two-component system sensor histidine kinase DesK